MDPSGTWCTNLWTCGARVSKEGGSLLTREGTREPRARPRKTSTLDKMATLSDLKGVKEALDAGLLSQTDYDDVKRDYLRTQREALEAEKEAFELKKMELRAKKEALATFEDFQKRELIAKEEFQKRKRDAELRKFALDAIVKHWSSLMSEEQRVDLVRDYVWMSGLDRSAGMDGPSSKRQRIKAEPRDASPPQTVTPTSTSAATNQAPGAPAPSTSTRGVVINEGIWRILNVSGLDRGTTQRDASVLQLQPSTPPAPAAVLPPADAPVSADEDEYSNCFAGTNEDGSDCVEPTTAERRGWTEDDDNALVAALRAGQRVTSIRISGRSGKAARERLSRARENGLGSPALREYVEETCPEYVYETPSRRRACTEWSAEEEETFIQAHREGKMYKEIAAMLPEKTEAALRSRWRDARSGRIGTAALRAYAAKCIPSEKNSWSVEDY